MNILIWFIIVLVVIVQAILFQRQRKQAKEIQDLFDGFNGVRDVVYSGPDEILIRKSYSVGDISYTEEKYRPTAAPPPEKACIHFEGVMARNCRLCQLRLESNYLGLQNASPEAKEKLKESMVAIGVNLRPLDDSVVRTLKTETCTHGTPYRYPCKKCNEQVDGGGVT